MTLWNFHLRMIPFWTMNYLRKPTKLILSYARSVWSAEWLLLLWRNCFLAGTELCVWRGHHYKFNKWQKCFPVQSSVDTHQSNIWDQLRFVLFCCQTDCNQSTYSTDFIMSDTEPLDLSDGQKIGETLNIGYDDDRVLEDSGISYTLISIIIIIIISILIFGVFIIMFIRHRSLCQHRRKSRNERFSCWCIFWCSRRGYWYARCWFLKSSKFWQL